MADNDEVRSNIFWRHRLPKGHTVTLILIVLFFVNVDGKWACHSTVCEVDIHFCNDESKRCEACEDYAHLCFTKFQQQNCSSYCMEYKLRQIREQGCQMVLNVKNGYEIGSHTNVKYNHSVEFECADGFKMTGEKILTCVEYGQWSAAPPVCQVATCRLPMKLPDDVYFTFIPSVMQNEIAGSEADIFVGSKLNFRCIEGFRLEGIETMNCTTKGRWDTDRLPFCVQTELPKQDKICSTEIILLCIFGVIAVVSAVFVGFVCIKLRKKSKKPKTIKKMVNGEANGSVAKENAAEENEKLLTETGIVPKRNDSATNLKRSEEVRPPRSRISDGSDTASTSSGKSSSNLSDERTSNNAHSNKTAPRQREPYGEGSQGGERVMIATGNTAQPVYVYNDINVTQNVCAHNPNDVNQPLPKPDNIPANNADTTFPMQETGQTKSASARSIRPVQPRSDDTENKELSSERSMVQASMPKQEEKVNPPNFALLQSTLTHEHLNNS